MTLKRQQTPLDRVYHFEQESPDKVFMRQPHKGEWLEWNWKKFGREVRTLAASIKQMNLPPQSKIALLSKNCSHWIITDLAIWMSGHISVPIYPTLTGKGINDILEHSESALLFVGKLDEWSSQKSGITSTIPKVSFPLWDHEGNTSWDEFIKGNKPLTDNPNRELDEVATIIYTSGTTGQPKGVVHSFQSFVFVAEDVLIGELALTQADSFFSYLPLSHVAERLLVELGGIYCGGLISFCESLELFKDNLVESSPTVFLGVPRIWAKFQLGVLAKVPSKKLKLLLSIPLLKQIIRKKIVGQLGLINVRHAVTGAAPISIDLLEWYKKLGITIQEVYGMTENLAYSHYSFKDDIKYGYVGKIWPGMEAKIAENGEILVKSKANMLGYYKMPELSKEVLPDDGFLHTGDKGEIDSEGHLKITGRIKDLFKTSKGKYVSPAPIEILLGKASFIEQVCVIGNGLPSCLALVVLSEIGKELDSASLENQCQEIINEVNSKIEKHEMIKKIVIVNDEWSVETDILTPTMKIKRQVVEQKYSNNFETWSENQDTIIRC